LEDVQGVRKISQTPSDDPGLLRIDVLPEDHSDPRVDIYAAIKTTDWLLVDFHRETKTLETIFRELTKEN
jgi:ABC-2 type transport system ATP-binding protein